MRKPSVATLGTQPLPLVKYLKPANILITATGYAKLADFGLAKLEQRLPSGDSTLIRSEAGISPGMVLGPIGYMSPQ
jgi:serine/threonine protein kinase